MSGPRRLDKTRSYGQIFPMNGRAAWSQDGLEFDQAGNCLDDPPERSPQPATEEKATPPGGLFISGPNVIEAVPPSTPLVLAARPVTEWKTMPFPQLRKLLLDAKGYKAPNRVAALHFLDGLNLVTKD